MPVNIYHVTFFNCLNFLSFLNKCSTILVVSTHIYRLYWFLVVNFMQNIVWKNYLLFEQRVPFRLFLYIWNKLYCSHFPVRQMIEYPLGYYQINNCQYITQQNRIFLTSFCKDELYYLPNLFNYLKLSTFCQ